ncbi:MAG: hypothetical protein Q9198_011000 [Flavoplaca austrocitrina]
MHKELRQLENREKELEQKVLTLTAQNKCLLTENEKLVKHSKHWKNKCEYLEAQRQRIEAENPNVKFPDLEKNLAGASNQP